MSKRGKFSRDRKGGVGEFVRTTPSITSSCTVRHSGLSTSMKGSDSPGIRRNPFKSNRFLNDSHGDWNLLNRLFARQTVRGTVLASEPLIGSIATGEDLTDRIDR